MLRHLILFCLAISLGLSVNARLIREISLTNGWEFRQLGTEKWNPAEVPGTVHTDLFRNGLIPDPYMGTNPDSLRWIEEEDWEYRLKFNLLPKYLRYEHMELVFEGLDTYTEIFLNDEPLLRTANAYRKFEGNAKKYLREGENELRIVFKSPKSQIAPRLMQYPYALPAGNDDADTKLSPFARKPPYHFGWDWAPRMVSAGISQPIFIRLWEGIRVDRVKVVTESISENAATVKGEVWVEGSETTGAPDQLTVMVDGKAMTRDTFRVGRVRTKVPFEVKIEDPKLWWPNGYGDANLYEFEIVVGRNGEKKDSSIVQIGLREVELVREKDTEGESFYFKVNGEPIYVRGGNYVPTDMFLPRGREQEAYVLREMEAAHFNMVRVWAGGGYASNEFYDFCDRNGILVWQDLPFANALYPFGRGFRGRVRVELLQQVVRLRNHPSLALWCGNNEIEVAWKNWGWATEMGINESDSLKISNRYREFFQKYIPGQLKRHDGTRPYVSTSPTSNWGKLENFDAGSMHYWGVWHGDDDFADYKKYIPRFMVEYGWQSYPAWKTLSAYAPSGLKENKNYLESDFMDGRQLSNRPNSFLLEHIEQYYGTPSDVEGFCGLSQLVQADGMDIALQAHRDAFPRNMGTMYWQLNDAWPGASWSTIDYAGRAKAAYYRVRDWYHKRTLATEIEGDSLVTYLYNDEVWKQGRVRWTLYDHKGKTLWMRERRVRLAFEGPRVRLAWAIEEELEKVNNKKAIMLVEWIEVGEETETEVFHALPPAELKLKTPKFKHRMFKKGGENFLEITAQNTIKGMEVQFNDVVVPLSDNYFDLVPGQVKVVKIDAPKLVPEYLEEKIQFRSLLDWMK